MNALKAILQAFRRDLSRWKNARQRARRVVYTWPKNDTRNWSDEYMRSLRHG